MLFSRLKSPAKNHNNETTGILSGNKPIPRIYNSIDPLKQNSSVTAKNFITSGLITTLIGKVFGFEELEVEGRIHRHFESFFAEMRANAAN